MTALLALHPGLREAFRGIWLRADQGNVSVFALDLPMDQIPAGTQSATNPTPVAMTQNPPILSTFDPTKPEVQPSLDVDRDPVLSRMLNPRFRRQGRRQQVQARPARFRKGRAASTRCAKM